MLTIDNLAQFGVDTKDGVERCMGNEDFYLRLVNLIPGDQNFLKLFQAFEDNNLDAAFEAAHALKGVLGNLSLTPILDPVAEVTELLRSRTQMDYSPYAEKIKGLYEEFVKICE